MKRIHFVHLPHTQVSPAFFHCAYTQKAVNFCKMMQGLYEIHVYAPEGPDIPGCTLHPCLSNTRRLEIFGSDDQSRLYAWPSDEQTAEFNVNVLRELTKTWQQKELILLSAGWTHRMVFDAFPMAIRAEPGVGYYGTLPGAHRAFESYAHMHGNYVRQKTEDIQYYDTVIHPYADPADFPLLNSGHGRYLFYIGRLIQRKGIATAADIAKALKMPLWVAGGGAKHIEPGLIIGAEDTRITGDVHYCGAVDQKKRNELMAGARAVVIPTTYAEPGGNISIEANMSGTPALAIDYGVFTETVIPKINGARFRTLQDAVYGLSECSILTPAMIRKYAHEHFSLEATAVKFDRWFRKLETLWGDGWYHLS